LSADSPGAIAAGDLDRVVDEDGNYHDEIAIGSEVFDGTRAQVALSVFDYAKNPGQATVNATVIGLPGGAFTYPFNISHLNGAKNLFYPGAINVAVGDFDGDGVNEVAVVALTFDENANSHNLQAYFYKYQPGYNQQPPVDGALVLMDFVSIDGGPI